MSAIAPSLLVAVPQMQDPNFSRTVTLLIESNEDGAFGIVLNRMSPIKLADICEAEEIHCGRDRFVRIGGPVEQERAWVLHGPSLKDEHTLEISPDIYLTPTWDMLQKLANPREIEEFQVYLGYAGWGPGQLETELTEGTWLITELDRDLLFDKGEDTDIWKTVIRKMGLEPGTIAPGGGVH